MTAQRRSPVDLERRSEVELEKHAGELAAVGGDSEAVTDDVGGEGDTNDRRDARG